MDRLIIGLMLSATIINSVGIFCIWKRMVDYDNDYWMALDDEDGDDDSDDEDIYPPYKPKNRIRSN